MVKALRQEKGLTPERLAKQAGITVTYVSRIENGRRNLTWTALTRLCHGLGVQRSALVALLEEAEPSEEETAPLAGRQRAGRGLRLPHIDTILEASTRETTHSPGSSREISA
ncbi:MAG TPA: helix-turn-helix transcriptional regulator [Solirubrobacterales bacterium]|nr:helix-turn-helix transcriptional regulator [Solirubrobacterales bacterium]